MGCILSSAKDGGGTTKQEDIFVFAPAFRVPRNTDSLKQLHHMISEGMVDRLTALRARIGVIATGESFTPPRLRRKAASIQQGESLVSDLQQALEDYLPILLGLTKEESQLQDFVAFSWSNQEDDENETTIGSSLYELLSVLHLMAVLGLSQTNLMLRPNSPDDDGYQPKITEDSKQAAIGVFLKVSGILEYAVNCVIPNISEEIQKKLPADLTVGVLRALAVQALGQGVEIQLGLAINNLRATLAVKRRLACEQVKYWKQALDSIHSAHVGSRWGKKHILFIKWKLSEAHAAAYYYHGLMLDEGKVENSHEKAVACLRAAHIFLTEGEKIHSEFCATDPPSRVLPLWGAMKYLSEKIPKDAIEKGLANKDIYHQGNIEVETLPPLPDFPLALQAEEYLLPAADASWDIDALLHCRKSLPLNGT